jgi:hypothetical protein
MRVTQAQWTAMAGWSGLDAIAADTQLVLVFGAGEALTWPGVLDTLRARAPQAVVVGCSTAGEIAGTRVFDHSIVATAATFAATRVRTTSTPIEGDADSFVAGHRLASSLQDPDLTHVLVFSDGLAVNGSQLAAGLAGTLGAGVQVTGGLAGDGTAFSRTFVVADGQVSSGMAAAVGLYGSRLRVGCASLGGWEPFGPERLVTRARGNVLYELDGQSALTLYRKYLGPHAAGLPASALLFPLTVREPGHDAVVRTVLSVDDEAQSMTFAGDVPEGAHARLMKSSVDRLIDGATGAARRSAEGRGDGDARLALLISCVGRKLVLKQRTEEEVEAVRAVVGPGAVLTGFYSYGELSPFAAGGPCRLHNQTMTITTLAED